MRGTNISDFEKALFMLRTAGVKKIVSVNIQYGYIITESGTQYSIDVLACDFNKVYSELHIDAMF